MHLKISQLSAVTPSKRRHTRYKHSNAPAPCEHNLQFAHTENRINCGCPPPPAEGIVLVSISPITRRNNFIWNHKHAEHSTQITCKTGKHTKVHFNFFYLLKMMHSKNLLHTYTFTRCASSHYHMQCEISLVFYAKTQFVRDFYVNYTNNFTRWLLFLSGELSTVDHTLCFGGNSVYDWRSSTAKEKSTQHHLT